MPLFISEYARIAMDAGHQSTGVPLVPPVADHRIEIGVQSVQSESWQGGTVLICLHATESCCLAFGINPEAEHDKHYLAAGETRYYGIQNGHRLAVIASGD